VRRVAAVLVVLAALANPAPASAYYVTKTEAKSSLLQAAALSAVASAPDGLRTGARANRYPNPDKSRPTRPELDRAQIRYDADAGRLDATVFLYDGLADPASTSALRPWAIKVTVGDFMSNGVCIGDLATWLRIDAGLGDLNPGTLLHTVDFDDKLPALGRYQDLQ